ncbi:hypothetical protein RV134_310201 [Roseovarius sp. EC-HK134]|nr:hypothetical protein RV420_360308 [Roseovarius sp. EC-SD190]VVT20342.1 hypothetical protein RV134_310201 [Roseovarius sp. EC-HK134]
MNRAVIVRCIGAVIWWAGISFLKIYDNYQCFDLKLQRPSEGQAGAARRCLWRFEAAPWG